MDYTTLLMLQVSPGETEAKKETETRSEMKAFEAAGAKALGESVLVVK